MIIRPYKPQDLLALHKIETICFPKGIAYTQAELRHYITTPRSLTLVAEDDNGQIVGFIVAQVECWRKQAPQPPQLWGHIITIDILPSFRRHGLGQALLKEAEQWLMSQGCVLIELEVSIENAPAIAFYQKNGYRPCWLLSRYYPDGTDAYLMQKEVSSPADAI
ncbi:MAG: N-acetyltransferase [Acidobacteriota bacterium]|nr:GNAT family N-acetyltransferase [Blastocatellia bacterium]MDW8240467.1 N-acetyltransferase [Acidobacteriota bacterium]